MKETKKTAKRTKMAAVSMALAAMMAGQTVVVMAGESDSNVLYTFPLTDGIEIEASTMDFNRDTLIRFMKNAPMSKLTGISAQWQTGLQL